MLEICPKNQLWKQCLDETLFFYFGKHVKGSGVVSATSLRSKEVCLFELKMYDPSGINSKNEEINNLI